MHHFSYQCQ